MTIQTSPHRQPSDKRPPAPETPLARLRSGWDAMSRASTEMVGRARLTAQARWDAPTTLRVRRMTLAMRRAPWSGFAVILAGSVFSTLLIMALDRYTFLPNTGVVYLPVVAFIAYYWDWRHGAAAALLDLLCLYVFVTPPSGALKAWTPTLAAELLTDAAAIAFTLAVVQLASSRRALAEHEATRFASLSSVGLALSGELDEERLLRLIARTACDLTGAGFAAFTLRPVDPMGRPVTPARGDLFYLAAVVGVTPEQEALFRRMPLGGEGLLGPIFRFGRTVRVADAQSMTGASGQTLSQTSAITGAPPFAALSPPPETARSLARAYSQGEASVTDLRGMGVPRGHPVVRSFLGAPLLDRKGEVRGGLLLGHIEPGRFTAEDERLLQGLAAQAATAIENARLYRSARSQAQELDVIFESIADGVTLTKANGEIIRENTVARTLRESLAAEGGDASSVLTQAFAHATTISVEPQSGERRAYLVSMTPARADADENDPVTGADADEGSDDGERVVVWHDVTETQQLIEERRARADAEARRQLLQVVVDELPTGVYLAHGPDARLALANRAALNFWGGEWQVGQPMLEFLESQGARVLWPDGQPMAFEELATLRALRTGEPVRHHEQTIVRADGATSPVLFNAVTFSAELLVATGMDSHLAGQKDERLVVVVLQDLTPIKQAERLKDEFIALAAHELRTPMAAVKGYAEMLKRTTTGAHGAPLEEWQLEALDSIDLATTRLVDLTNDLLDVSRLQANRMELQREPHDLLALSRRVARRFAVTTQRHELIVRSPQQYVVADIDAPRMEQTLGNLLSNAIKYSPDGGEIVIEVEEDRQAGVARLCVRDHGIGIPEEQQAQLFSRFARAENARELGIGGTGLGLYLCRELLTRLDGRIWLESETGVGTTVHIEVPLHADDADDSAES